MTLQAIYGSLRDLVKPKTTNEIFSHTFNANKTGTVYDAGAPFFARRGTF